LVHRCVYFVFFGKKTRIKTIKNKNKLEDLDFLEILSRKLRTPEKKKEIKEKEKRKSKQFVYLGVLVLLLHSVSKEGVVVNKRSNS